MYDEERMVNLVRAWAIANCDTFGEQETGILYADFKRWIFDTRSMKRFPGATVFGQAMRLAGYEKRRKAGETLWAGITLKGITGRSPI